MIIFLHGKEKYLVFQRYLELKKEFHKKNEKASVFEFDAGDEFDLTKAGQVLSEGGGLFSEKKMIIFKDLFLLSVSAQKNLLESIEQSPIVKDQEIFLIVAEMHSSPAKGKLLNFLKKNSRIEESKPLQGVSLEKWITDEVSKRSRGEVSIKIDAVKKIAEVGGNSLWATSKLIDSLVSYCEKEIKVQDVSLFGKGRIEAKVFDLVDAMGQRNISSALRTKQNLLAQGENEFLIFSMLVSQLRNLLKVNEGMKRGMHPDSIASSFGMHPFVVKKNLVQLRNFSQSKLKKMFQLAAEIDLKAKTGEAEMKDSLDYFIAKI